MNRGFDIEEMHLGQQRSSRRGIFRTKFTKSHPDPLAEKAVHWAAVKGEETALRLLLERGCNPSSFFLRRSTVVIAAEFGQWNTVNLLIAYGADTLAGYNIYDCWFDTRNAYEMKEFKVNETGRIAGMRGLIHVAADANQSDLIALLLDFGTKVDIKMELCLEGYNVTRTSDQLINLQVTALHVAVKNCSYEAAKLLLERGADVNREIGVVGVGLAGQGHKEACQTPLTQAITSGSRGGEAP
jgi:ankyrin repeat protein